MAYTVQQAKTNLPRLLKEAKEGKEVVIARGKKPAVRLVVVEEKPVRTKRVLGQYAGQFQYPDDLFKPLETDEELREYGFDILVDGKKPGEQSAWTPARYAYCDLGARFPSRLGLKGRHLIEDLSNDILISPVVPWSLRSKPIRERFRCIPW